MTTSERNIPNTAIAIVDWNVSGHHPTYLREFAAAFSNMGNAVVVLSPICPDTRQIRGTFVWRRIATMEWLRKKRLLGPFIARRLYAKNIKRHLSDAEAELGIACQRIFFPCLYENQGHVIARVMDVLALPASGLYLQATYFHLNSPYKKRRRNKVLAVLRHSQMKVIFMLDESVAAKVRDFIGKDVIILPDITDHSIAPEDPLPERLGLLPKKRPVIGLLGHLRPGKGVAEMITFARDNPNLDVTFLLAGSCEWRNFPEQERNIIMKACNEDERIIFHPERIPNETSYNALILACDVLWAVYRDNPHSSNTLTKAAYFERPVVVADGHMMARKTREYRLGVVVPANQRESLNDLIIPLLEDTSTWREAQRPRWNEYRMMNSIERFQLLLESGQETMPTADDWLKDEIIMHQL